MTTEDWTFATHLLGSLEVCTRVDSAKDCVGRMTMTGREVLKYTCSYCQTCRMYPTLVRKPNTSLILRVFKFVTDTGSQSTVATWFPVSSYDTACPVAGCSLSIKLDIVLAIQRRT